MHILLLFQLTICVSICVFQAFAQLLQAPHMDTELIIRERFPVPRLVVCDQHGSQVCYFHKFFLASAYFPKFK